VGPARRLAAAAIATAPTDAGQGATLTSVLVTGINQRGQLVGAYENPSANPAG
jgi:hypothetical protein